jgi:hypothetical protein
MDHRQHFVRFRPEGRIFRARGWACATRTALTVRYTHCPTKSHGAIHRRSIANNKQARQLTLELVWATRGISHLILVDEIQDSIAPKRHFRLREKILLPKRKGIHVFLKCLGYVWWRTRYWYWQPMLNLSHVFSKKHSCMDRERMRVWCPLERPTFDKDLAGLVFVLKKFLFVADVKKFGTDVIVERPFAAEFVAAV